MPRNASRSVSFAVVACSLVLSAAEPLSGGGYVWWEGEDPAKTNFPDETWFSAVTFPNNRNRLSGGAWLTNIGERSGEEAFAVYAVRVPKADEYDFWTRKFWKHGPFRWRFDGGEWRTCGRDCALADSTFLKTHVGANWVHLGKVRLDRGEHRFELRLLAGKGESLTAGFDCFLLTPTLFIPRGRLKPDDRSGRSDEGFFPWEPGVDAFSPDAALDLRKLNERVAGEHGFVRRSKAGDDLLLADGAPVRFWGVNVSSGIAAGNRAGVDYLARKLAKLGVNAVRYHSPLFDRADPAKVDAERLDDLHYLVAAMKREGVYTTLSIYFPLWFDVKPRYGLAGYDEIDNDKPFALLYFNERMQEMHAAWLRGLLTTPNPYTDTPLADEPAVAMVEIVNEDSLLFWTFAEKNVPPVQWRMLERRFGAWLADRYGSLPAALKQWPGARHEHDDADGGRAGVYEVWHMTGDGLARSGPDKVERLRVQARFLAELQRGYYERTREYIVDELGYGGLVIASNWRTADRRLLGPIERWTYTAADVIDRHGYFGGMHKGDGSNYSVREGHAFDSAAAVRRLEGLPLATVQPAGHPQIISELGWPQPNRTRADAPVLAAACASIQGIDGLFWFAVGEHAVFDTTMRKFQLGSPVIAGGFPAAALAYRRGYVPRAVPAVVETLDVDAMLALSGSAAAAPAALDELRKADLPPGERADGPDGRIDPLAFYVGPVLRRYGDAAKLTYGPATAEAIDRESGRVVCPSGVAFDHEGVDARVTVKTARVRAVAGFVAGAELPLTESLTLRIGNEYAAAVCVPLDDRTLGESRRAWLQVFTEDRPFGFRAGNTRIKSLGGYPFGVREIDATLTGEHTWTVQPLDENAAPAGDPLTVGGAGPVPLPADRSYYLLTR